MVNADPSFAHHGSFQNLVGHYPLTQQEADKFSCDRLVTEKTPPTFLWHTASDDCVPVKNSLVYAQSLEQHGVSFELHIYPEGFHGLATADAQTNDDLPPALSEVKTWLTHLKSWLARLNA